MPAEHRRTAAAPRLKLVHLSDRQNAETRDALRQLYELAVRGELNGMAICYTMRDGQEVVLRTGPFRRKGLASRAGFLIQMEDFALDGQA